MKQLSLAVLAMLSIAAMPMMQEIPHHHGHHAREYSHRVPHLMHEDHKPWKPKDGACYDDAFAWLPRGDGFCYIEDKPQ